MRLIDADNYIGKVIASHCYSGVNKVIRIDDVPTVDVNNLIIAELEKIKAEIEKFEYEDFDCNLALSAWEVYDILDNHISELKGENNIPISEFKKSYEVAMEYLKNQAKIKG